MADKDLADLNDSRSRLPQDEFRRSKIDEFDWMPVLSAAGNVNLMGGKQIMQSCLQWYWGQH